MDSLNRFMSPSDLSSLWQNPDANQYHLNYENSCSLNYTFGTACMFDAAMNARYGKPSSLAQYVEEAQAQDYEDVRAQFEAFIDHANNAPLPSTGTIYWQMNKGWPSLLWSLYGSDGDQAGSYFGAQEANRPLHALYALDNGTVTLDNLSNATRSGLTVEAKVYSVTGALLNDQTASGITLSSQQVKNKVLTPAVPKAGSSPAQVYFVELLLKPGRDAGRPQRLLAVHPAGRDELAADTRQPGRRDHHVRQPARVADAGAVVPVGYRRHHAASRAERGRPGDHGHHQEHIGVRRRVPGAGRCPARYRQRPGTARGQ